MGNQMKPAILQCFGDVAQAIGGEFQAYLPVVAQVLEQAAGIEIDTTVSFEMLDYIVSLREGITDAWAGAIMALKAGNRGKVSSDGVLVNTDFGPADALKPYVPAIFKLLQVIFQDQNRSENLLRSSMGVIG